MRFSVLLLTICCISPAVHAQTLQESLDDAEVGEHWQYNDWEKAKAAAARSGKPILALFR